MLTFILIICGLISLILMAVILASNHKTASNRWLAVFIGSGFLWLVANVLANMASTNEWNLFFSRLALVGASVVPLAFLIFCIRFTVQRKISNRFIRLLAVPVILLILSTPTDLNIKSVSNDGFIIEPGLSYGVLLGLYVVYFTIGLELLRRSFKHSGQQRKEQLRYIIVGTLLTVVPALLMSAIMPVFDYSAAVPYAPSVVIFFSIFTTLAIVKHRLFDIRSYVVRGMAYIATTLSLGLMYIGPLLYALLVIIAGVQISWGQFIFVVLAITIAATSYHHLKQRFDTYTRRIFFRDAYDSAELLSRLNRLLVSNTDIHDMLHGSSTLIADYLKSEFCVFVLHDESSKELRAMGQQKKLISKINLEEVDALFNKLDEKVVVTDYLESPQLHIQKNLIKNDIAVAVRLSGEYEGVNTTVGYMFIGYKKSGKIYDSQDLLALQAMADVLILAIQNALQVEEIRSFNFTLQQKVEQATRQLRKTNAKLEAMDETKDDFISMASHQLRTPLTSVKGYLSMVLEEDAGPVTPMQKKMLDQAYVSSQRMVFLIADLLNVSRLKTGKFIIEPTKMHLQKIVQDEVNQLKATAKSRKLDLMYDKPASLPEVMLDETKIRQVIMNFIDNAIYYTPAGGTIEVLLKETATSVELRIKDNGIGVPKHEQQHLFTKFYRAGNARRSRPDGTGLGLFMAKKVIIAQGGAVIFESKEGKGSTFGFVFPKAKILAPAVAPRPRALLAR